MRILLISGEYPPMQGGVGDYTHELAKAFIALGAEVDVLTATGGAGPEEGLSSGEPRVHPSVAQWNWGVLSTILYQIRVQQPDVVHIQYQTAAFAMHPAINALPWWAKKRLGPDAPRFLVTYHDVKIPYLFPKAGPLRDWVTLFIGRHSDAAVVTNEEDRQWVDAHRWETYARTDSYRQQHPPYPPAGLRSPPAARTLGIHTHRHGPVLFRIPQREQRRRDSDKGSGQAGEAWA